MAPPDQQVLRVNDAVEPNSFDPTQQTYGYEAAVARRTFEPLLQSKPDLSDVAPDSAQSYDVSSDGLTYTFHLRANAKWSDGKPVVAKDWVYGFKHLLNPALAAGYVDPFFDTTIAGAQDYANVDVKSASAIDSFLNGLGLSAPDDHTFVIKLRQPAGFFKWVVTLWLGVPLRQDIVERAAAGPFPSTDVARAEAWANDPRTIVGNGMFKLSEIAPKDHATVLSNPYYWDGPPRLQKITYYYINDANTAFLKYRTGGLDSINVSPADVSTVKNDPKLSKQARLYPRLQTAWIEFNASKAPFDDPKVRLALAKSIDRDQLANDVLHGMARPADTLIPRGMPGFDTSDDAQKFDPAAARQLLQQTGVTPAQLGQYKLLTRDTTAAKTLNQFLVAQWQQNLGASISLEVIDSKTVTSRIRHGQFDIYGIGAWIADYPDEQDWFDIFVSGACRSLDSTCARLPGYDGLVSKADQSSSVSQRLNLYSQAQKVLVDDVGGAFLYQADAYDLVQPWVKGLKPTPMDEAIIPGDLFFHDVYITKH